MHTIDSSRKRLYLRHENGLKLIDRLNFRERLESALDILEDFFVTKSFIERLNILYLVTMNRGFHDHLIKSFIIFQHFVIHGFELGSAFLIYFVLSYDCVS